MRRWETCALPAGLQPGNDGSWRFEVDLKANRTCCLTLAMMALVLPAIARAQQSSEPLVPGIPGRPDDRQGAGVPSVPPIPDTSNRATSTPAGKPVTPAQQPPVLQTR